MIKAQSETAPLGIIDSISAGFSAVAQKPILLLIPLMLDLFLWLGPRLSITPLVPDMAAQLAAVTGETADNSALLFEKNMIEILGSYNMFSALSTWPVGTPSLLAGNESSIGPLGTPLIIEIQARSELAVWLLALILSGLLLGNVYLGFIARWTGDNRISPGTWARHVWKSWARIVALVITVLLGAFLLSVPFFLAVEMVAAFMAPLASLLLLVGVGISMWGLFHLFFAIHGILLYDLGVRQTMRFSIALVQRYRLSSVGLLLIAVVIGLGLTTIWNLPPSGSWMRLIGIAGNAFVNTGLTAATFIFFRERTSL
jgi:hypothetical protein